METKPILFVYTNHRGEVGHRIVDPKRIWFGTTAWYPEEQWFLEGWDTQKKAKRDFALNRCEFKS